MSRRNYGEASTLLAQPAAATARAAASVSSNANRGPSTGRASSRPNTAGAVASSSDRGRSASGSYAGGPTKASYSASAAAAPSTPSAQQQQQRGVAASGNRSRGATPVPNKNGPPQPTPRGPGAAASGLVNTPAPASASAARAGSSSTAPSGRGSPIRGPQYNSDSNDSGIFAQRGSRQQQQQQHPSFQGTGADLHMFTKRMPATSEYQSVEARDALRQTIDNEKHLQGLVKARRDRALELFQMLRNEGDEWQQRLDATNRQLQQEEKKRLELAAQARQIETEALNLRHKLRQVQNKRKNAALAAAAGSSSSASGAGDDAPHTIIRSVLQKYGGLGGDGEDSSSGDDDEYAAVLARDDPSRAGSSSAADDDMGGARSSNLWFTNSGKNKKQRTKLSKAERLHAAGKIAEQLEQSVRVTRLSVESRVAELEATLNEISSLQNQRIGFGATVEEMRGRVRDVQRTLQQATWLQSCLPLLEQTVRQRDALAKQGEEYGRRVLDNLMLLNKRDDETTVVLQERAERNLLSTDQLIRMVQEENAHMSRELGEAVRDAETWRASMQATSERYERQLQETENAIVEASNQRRASTF